MERKVRRLAQIHGQERSVIVRCLHETAKTHQLSLEKVLTIVLKHKPLPVEPSPKVSPKRGPTQESLIKRAQKIWMDRFTKDIRKSSPSKLGKVFYDIFRFLRDSKLYTTEFADKLFEMMMKSLRRGRLAALQGHGITESQVRRRIATVFAQRGEPIEKVIEAALSANPSEKEMVHLMMLGIAIKKGGIHRDNPRSDVANIMNTLLDVGTANIKNSVLIELS